MREMALADLQAVAERLKLLHKRLNRETAHEWTLLEIAQAADVKPRTFQTWIGAKNENRDGKGYEKIARFYRRKLDDPTITKKWIVFGDNAPEGSETPDLMTQLSDGDPLEPIRQQLVQLQEGLNEIQGIAREWLAERDAAFARQDAIQERRRGTEPPDEQTGTANGT